MSLSVIKVSKRFGNKWVLRDVSFSVEPGETVAIFSELAESGTALLKVIGAKEDSNGGTIELAGLDCRLVSNGGETSTFLGLKISKRDDPDRKLNVQEISLTPDNSLLLLDSPFEGAFKTDRYPIGEAIKTAVSSGNSAVIFSTCDFKDAIEFADRTIVILNSYVEQDAPPQEIYERPVSLAVASVVGRNNLITARRLTSTKNDIPEFVTIDGDHRLFAQRTENAALGPLNKNVTLAIRPEQISISFGASFPEDNLLKATVAEVKPLGPTTRVTLDCGGLKLEALVLRLVGLNIGEECMVGLPPDRIAVLAN